MRHRNRTVTLRLGKHMGNKLPCPQRDLERICLLFFGLLRFRAYSLERLGLFGFLSYCSSLEVQNHITIWN